MVCDRCIMSIKVELEQLGLEPLDVKLGEAEVVRELTTLEKAAFDTRLQILGFERIDDQRTRLVEGIKNTVVEMIYSEAAPKMTFSEYLSEKFHRDYSALSKIFSETHGTTLEQYVIHQKIERVKELLLYKELSLSEIAYQLNYSSVSHLSKQFKKIVGLTPTEWGQGEEKWRTPLDKL